MNMGEADEEGEEGELDEAAAVEDAPEGPGAGQPAAETEPVEAETLEDQPEELEE